MFLDRIWIMWLFRFDRDFPKWFLYRLQSSTHTWFCHIIKIVNWQKKMTSNTLLFLKGYLHISVSLKVSCQWQLLSSRKKIMFHTICSYLLTDVRRVSVKNAPAFIQRTIDYFKYLFFIYVIFAMLLWVFLFRMWKPLHCTNMCEYDQVNSTEV